MHLTRAFQLFGSIVSAAYVIQDDYPVSDPTAWGSKFDFFTGNDPTDGYVNYIDQGTAMSKGLLKTDGGAMYMGVDNTNQATGRGRDSIRISSKKSYNHGLIVLDLKHMPGSACGSWPAFWLLGPDPWPITGEVDIIEGVNSQVGNSFAMHTNAGCSITNTGKFSGSMKYSNCDSYAKEQPSNVGCQITSGNSQSYGDGFNGVGGGVFATEWTNQAISIWHFPRNAIPADLKAGNPNPSAWGLPSAQFTGACDFDKHVFDQKIMFDITFCGQWAGQVWDSDSSCKSKPNGNTCQGFVQKTPEAFKETFWSINSLKVYQDNGAPAPIVPSTSTTTGRVSFSTSALVGSSTTLRTQSTIMTTVIGKPQTTTNANPRPNPPVPFTSTFTSTTTFLPSSTSLPSTTLSTTPSPSSSQPTTTITTTSLITSPSMSSISSTSTLEPSITTITTITITDSPNWSGWSGQDRGWNNQRPPKSHRREARVAVVTMVS